MPLFFFFFLFFVVSFFSSSHPLHQLWNLMFSFQYWMVESIDVSVTCRYRGLFAEMSFCDIAEEKSIKQTHSVQRTNHLLIPAICFDAAIPLQLKDVRR